MIRFEKVSKAYVSGTYAVRSLDLEIEQGELIVLVGPSGCGKTTTLKMINRLIEPDSGQIFIKGRNIQEINPAILRRQIGYVIQQIGLFPHMTIAQNVGLVMKLLGKSPREREKRVNELLEMVGFDPEVYRNRYPRELSGGQQQRIGVLRALAADPEIILMDEPFGALDPITREQLQDELKSLQNNLRKTIVFVTHDMDEAIKLADRIVVMREGKVVQIGTPEELLRNPADDFVRDFIGKKRLFRNPEEVFIGDIMLEKPVTGNMEMGAAEAFQRMQKHQVNSLLIVDERGALKGILTARGVQKAIQAASRQKASELMEPVAETVCPEETVLTATAIMARSKYGLLPVVDEQGLLKGLLTNASMINTLVDVLWPVEDNGTGEEGKNGASNLVEFMDNVS
ncbi:MAG: betaine/proline/choline family ABC transporter ATP-binding protein [Clostridia bacterium]|nr:betaine/proline/choline family ABC transporter ATP-binding protein [Clostridia bacterium]